MQMYTYAQDALALNEKTNYTHESLFCHKDNPISGTMTNQDHVKNRLCVRKLNKLTMTK